ncbi:MAG TPA: metallophosphoesterase [Pseudonocardia sp.]|uniref:metallophosphoesterase family protein n=1 Tax=Pseudonocardia sp. TaxID=60912 RepID=UPI002F3FE414
MTPRLLATSDLHVGHRDNRAIVEELHPRDEGDWLIVAGDVGEQVEDIEWALGLLAGRFASVIWVPGNHELWTSRKDPDPLRGVARYEHLVTLCRRLGVHTPEDEYPRWQGPGGPALVVPMFLLYDYTFRAPGTHTTQESLAYARGTGVVCSDEFLLDPDPYPSREEWCRGRVASTSRRLAACDPALPLVLVNHWPLSREPTRVLRYPEFAQWCGTELTADWHTRFRTAVSVYGHLHIPRTTWQDGVRFEEVSLGYPREWRARPRGPVVPRCILPAR